MKDEGRTRNPLGRTWARAWAGALWLSFVLRPSSFVLAASFTKEAAGTTAATVLKLSPDARASGMGGAFSAVAADATALYWNPAGLAAVAGPSLSLSQAFYLEKSNYQFVGYAQPLSQVFQDPKLNTRAPDWGTFGAAVLYHSAGAVDRFDNAGNAAGNFHPQDLVAVAGWGRAWGAWSAGASVKWVSSTLATTATAAAGDVGVRRASALAGAPWTWGLGVSNLGTRMKFAKDAFGLPTIVRLGQALDVPDFALLSLDLDFPVDNAPYAAAGAEWKFPVRGGAAASLRAGFNSQAAGQGLQGLAGLSAGAGLSLGGQRFDYAWVPFGDLGDTHRVSVSFRF